MDRDKSRLRIIRQCYSVIALLMGRRMYTAGQVADRLDIGLRSAYRYIHAAEEIFDMEVSQERPTSWRIRRVKGC
jgi:predicted DNA-binding transcriptional regulator YafY